MGRPDFSSRCLLRNGLKRPSTKEMYLLPLTSLLVYSETVGEYVNRANMMRRIQTTPIRASDRLGQIHRTGL